MARKHMPKVHTHVISYIPQALTQGQRVRGYRDIGLTFAHTGGDPITIVIFNHMHHP